MSASPRKPFTPEDLLLYQSISDLACSPDGSHAVFAVQRVDRAQDAYASALWIVTLAHGDARQFTYGSSSDTSPQWTHDGRSIAFVSTRSGAPQVYLIRRDGGEAHQVTDIVNGLSSFVLSRDDRRVLALSSQPVDPEARGATRAPPQHAVPDIAWKLPYKSNGAGYVLGRQTHLFVVDLDSGRTKQLTRGDFDVRSADWSPDGARIVYTRTRGARQDHFTDVWIMDADGTNARRLSHEVASAQSPKWSPDGRTIVFSGGERPGDANVRLWKIDVSSGRVQPFGPDWLEVVGSDALAWSPDSRSICFVNARRGVQEGASIALDDEWVDTLVCERGMMLRKLAVTDTHVAWVSSRLTEPCELYVANHDGGARRRVTNLNAWWGERTQPVAEFRQFTVPDGEGGEETIDGWLVTGEASAGTLPLLLDAHGGPQSYVDLDYRRYVHWSVLWSRGFAILATNAAGSSSYGPEFSQRIVGRWGELCFPQHMTAIDTLQRERRVDDRLAVTGKSYGGFLSAWAIGHTDRFHAAVVAAPVTNLQSHFGTSDSGFYVTSYAVGGEIWDKRDLAQRLSPVSYAHLATTPTLILQGKDDQRCPIGQSEELYATIVRAGDTPVELVVYPDEDHGVAEAGKPSNRVDYYRRVVDWVQRWAGGRTTDPAPADDTPASTQAETERVDPEAVGEPAR
jgi:dipeptidyl aminopeptidase/acylaminoacyl peptidase